MTIPDYDICDCGKRGTHAVCNKPAPPESGVTMLDGEWKVTCHGWAAMFNVFGDHKIIADGQGHNKAGKFEGAYFRVSPTYRLPGAAHDYDCALVYDDPRNHEFFRSVVDVMTKVSETKWKGQLCHNGEYKFSFSLERV